MSDATTTTTTTTDNPPAIPATPPTPAGSRFYAGMITGMIMATAIAMVALFFGFSDLNAKHRAQLVEVASKWAQRVADLESKPGHSTGEVARAAAERFAEFTKKWEAADTGIDRRHLLLRYIPEKTSTRAHLQSWRECYRAEYHRWWQEIERNYGGTPDEIVEDQAKAAEFYRLGSWSAACGEARDAHDAFTVAFRFHQTLEPARRALGHIRYQIPADIPRNHPEIAKLEQFHDRWATPDDRKLIAQFEAELRAPK